MVVERRVEVKISAEETAELPRWMKVVRPFVSRGMLNTARAGAAALSVVLTMLLVLSFLSVSANPVNAAVGAKLVELNGELETLTVTANLEQAERDWQEFAASAAENCRRF